MRRALFGVGAALATAFLASSGARSSDSLHWPTSAGSCLTSTFGEFREGHFHSGVDVSTGGKIGFPVYAVADAEVARVRQSCRGYGKAIYLRLKDGRYAVYAHLSEFAGAIAESVRAIQAREKDAHFDHSFPPNAIMLARGTMIGKTGQSGAGPPHLHFELRDAQERALDPLAHGLHAPDAKPPRITRVALTPLTPESSVDGDSRTVIVRAIPHKDGSFTAERVVPVEGRIGIGVEANDRIDACDRSMAPKRWELKEGTSTLFAVDCDRFSFDEWGQVDLQFDSRWTYSGEGEFVSLWRRPGNEFPASTGSWPAADGVTAESAGASRRTLRIAAIDARGNAAELSLTLSFRERTGDGESAAGSGVSHASSDFASVPPRVETRGGWIEVRFPDPPANMRIEPGDSGRPPPAVRAAGDGTRITVVPERPGPITLPVTRDQDGAPRRIDILIPGLTARANETGSVASEDSTVVIRFSARTLREDTIAMVRDHAPLPDSDELRLLGGLHVLDTGSVALAGEYEISMRQPSDFAGDPDHVGVFVHVGESFRYIGGANGRGSFVGSTQRPRPFGLFEDHRPPAIGRPRFVRRAGRWRVELRVRDRGAGVACDDLVVTLDGRRLLVEYDEETGEVVALLDGAPASGARSVRVRATDRLGNPSERTELVKAAAK